MTHPSWTIHSLYQPVVDLDTLDIVGYEALARGVAGSALESAGALFSAARANGDVAGLEWACRIAAIRGALDVGMPPGTSLFLNVEPATFALTAPPAVWNAADELSAMGVPVVVEVTERDLARDPRALFAMRDFLGERGWMLAIDDVGADPASLAMLPLLDPDVIKLDMALVQQQPDIHVARIMNAVNAQASLTGATVIAEGVETDRQRDHAVSFGATLAQGWLFGRPAPLPRHDDATSCASSAVTSLRDRRPAPTPEPATPWAQVESMPTVRTSAAPMLKAMSRHLESQALAGDDATVVLTAYQNADSLVGRTLWTYEAIARFAFFVGVLGHGVIKTPLPGVRGVDLAADDPLAREWNVVIVTPHFAAALIATEIETSPPSTGDDRIFNYVLTYHRPLVLQAARIILRRFDGSAVASSEGAVEPERPNAAQRLAAPHRSSPSVVDEQRHGTSGLEVVVRAAARRDDVMVHYQPIVEAGGDGRLHAVEALLRLDDGRGDALPARMFVGFAERLGLMPTFTSRLIEQACAQLRSWRDELGALAPAIVYVNVGHGALVDVDAIARVVDDHHLPASSIGFEFTAEPGRGSVVPAALGVLSGRGHPVALDRHGPETLDDPADKGLVPDTVKIDRLLVSTMVDQQSAWLAVRDVVDAAHARGCTTTAVGVETAAQRLTLHRMGCDFVQGFAIGEPQPASELDQYLLARHGDATGDGTRSGDASG